MRFDTARLRTVPSRRVADPQGPPDKPTMDGITDRHGELEEVAQRGPEQQQITRLNAGRGRGKFAACAPPVPAGP